MKLFLGSVLALAIAGSPLMARQEPQEDKDKPKQEEPKAKPKPEDKDKPKPKQEPAPRPDDKAKPQPKPDERQQQKADKERPKQDERSQQEANRPAQQRQNAPQAAPGGERAQGGGGRGQRIPEEKYRASFGREHHLHVRHAEQRFQYGGYWFEVAQPWPAAWVADDDCYIEEDGDEYFLVDLLHPDWRVEVIVVQG